VQGNDLVQGIAASKVKRMHGNGLGGVPLAGKRPSARYRSLEVTRMEGRDLGDISMEGNGLGGIPCAERLPQSYTYYCTHKDK
jgi:hypothetical protein